MGQAALAEMGWSARPTHKDEEVSRTPDSAGICSRVDWSGCTPAAHPRPHRPGPAAQKGPAVGLLLPYLNSAESEESQTEAARIQSSYRMAYIAALASSGILPCPDAPVPTAPPRKPWPVLYYLLLFRAMNQRLSLPLTTPLGTNGARTQLRRELQVTSRGGAG